MPSSRVPVPCVRVVRRVGPSPSPCGAGPGEPPGTEVPQAVINEATVATCSSRPMRALQRLTRTGGRMHAPERVDQPSDRDGILAGGQQHRQDGASAAAAERDPPLVRGDLDRSQHTELHLHRHP